MALWSGPGAVADGSRDHVHVYRGKCLLYPTTVLDWLEHRHDVFSHAPRLPVFAHGTHDLFVVYCLRHLTHFGVVYWGGDARGAESV